jgi:hypothetical protein
MRCLASLRALRRVRDAAIGIGAIALAAALAPAWAGDGASGKIEICRGSEIRYPGEKLRIEIPRGAVFGDSGRLVASGYGGAYWPLWIATTDAVVIAAAERCATATARIVGNMNGHRLHVVDDRLFVPSAAAQGVLPEWPGGVRLTAVARTDFK